jgi:hypothetical protein
MIELEFMELHQDLFLNGVNFSKKLDPKKRGGLRLGFHPDKSMITIEWNGKVAFMHWMNAANMIPKDAADIGVELSKESPPVIRHTYQTHPVKANISATAQVETPMSHVYKGKGSGKVRDTQP